VDENNAIRTIDSEVATLLRSETDRVHTTTTA
jgi:hypothetical protein